MAAPSVSSVSTETRLCVLLVRVVTAAWAGVALQLALSWPSLAQVQLQEEVLPTLATCAQLAAALSLLVFIIGEVTGNVSSVDRLWSLLPTLYTLLTWAQHGGPRLLLMAAVTSVWSARLTWNFWRRGGYSWPPWTGCEDYRWVYVRQWPVLNTRPGWSLFNLLFISLYQNYLLLGLAAPAWVAAAASATNPHINLVDWLAALTFLALVAVETVADNQQEDFQNAKKQLASAGDLGPPFSAGFISWGLFSISRHPNYLAEQMLWMVYGMFGVAATGSVSSTVLLSLVPALLLVLLFQGSTLLSESITGGKYPGYSAYARVTPRFIGNFWALRAEYPAVVTTGKID